MALDTVDSGAVSKNVAELFKMKSVLAFLQNVPIRRQSAATVVDIQRFNMGRLTISIQHDTSSQASTS